MSRQASMVKLWFLCSGQITMANSNTEGQSLFVTLTCLAVTGFNLLSEQ